MEPARSREATASERRKGHEIFECISCTVPVKKLLTDTEEGTFLYGDGQELNCAPERLTNWAGS